MNNTENKLTPAFRFPEFIDEGEWTEKQLSDILDYERPDNYIVNDSNYQKKGIPVLTANKSFILGYTNENFGLYTKLPAIIFDDFTVDNKYVDFTFKVKSSAIKILKAKDDDNLKFIYELISQIKFNAVEHKRYYISEYQNLNVHVPNPTEQKKIADCLTSLDILITSHTDRLDALKEHKKGLMQNLFPQEGETVPKLRFKEFKKDREWTEEYFSDLLDDIIDFRGRTPLKLGMNWGNGNIISLSANNVKNGFIDYDAECNLGSEDLYNKWMGNVNLERGDIVFTMEAPLGNALLVPDSQKYILSQRVVAFKTRKDVRSSFIIQLIWSNNFQSTIKKLATGSTAMGIGQKTLKNISVRIPKRETEQEKIGNILSSIDTIIIEQVERIKQLKLHKKGLMQGLFPKVIN